MKMLFLFVLMTAILLASYAGASRTAARQRAQD
jgi:hypothetical protein